MDPAIIWLLIGSAFVMFEVFHAPGIGFFLAGFGAITTGIVIKLGVVEDASLFAQLACFFGFTSAWALLLWKPLQKFRTHQKHKTEAGKERNDIVGTSAVVGKNGLKRGETGQVKWSGTIMNAVIDPHSKEDTLPEGRTVRVTAVSGTTLSVISDS